MYSKVGKNFRILVGFFGKLNKNFQFFITESQKTKTKNAYKYAKQN